MRTRDKQLEKGNTEFGSAEEDYPQRGPMDGKPLMEAEERRPWLSPVTLL